MAGATKRLVKAAAVLATSAVVERAVRKAAADPRVRRKVAEVTQAVAKQARATGKALGKRAKEQVVEPARKQAGSKLKRLGKLVSG